LDAKGLVALSREALLAQKVSLGAMRGYRHHPRKGEGMGETSRRANHQTSEKWCA